MYGLKHPSTGCYEVGAADICWPFIDDTDSGSDGDDDCGGLGCWQGTTYEYVRVKYTSGPWTCPEVPLRSMNSQNQNLAPWTC